jgi:hypothetical protein
MNVGLENGQTVRRNDSGKCVSIIVRIELIAFCFAQLVNFFCLLAMQADLFFSSNQTHASPTPALKL